MKFPYITLASYGYSGCSLWKGEFHWLTFVLPMVLRSQSPPGSMVNELKGLIVQRTKVEWPSPVPIPKLCSVELSTPSLDR